MYNWLCFFCLVIVLACRTDIDESSNYQHDSSVELVQLFEYEFETKSPVYVATENNNVYMWLPLSNELKIFDLDKKSIVKNVKTELKSPRKYKHIQYIGKDSLLFFSWKDNFNLKIIDSSGQIVDSYDLNNVESKNKVDIERNSFPTCYLKGSCGNLKRMNKIILSGYNIFEQKQSDKLYSGIELDINTKEFRYITTFPKVYNEYNWGGIYYYFPSLTVNDKNQIVMSYPACHKLSVYDVNGNITFKNGGSSFFKKIEPFGKEKKFDSALKEEYTAYFKKNNSYGAIIYDRNTKFYFRIAKHASLTYGSNWNDSSNKRSIIILDDELNFKGETLLPAMKNYWNQLFLTSNGVLIPYYDYNTGKRGFSVFKTVEK